MAVKIICTCDKCGKEFADEQTHGYLLTSKVSSANPIHTIDGNISFQCMLCNECQEELAKWLGVDATFFHKGKYDTKPHILRR